MSSSEAVIDWIVDYSSWNCSFWIFYIFIHLRCLHSCLHSQASPMCIHACGHIFLKLVAIEIGFFNQVSHDSFAAMIELLRVTLHYTCNELHKEGHPWARSCATAIFMEFAHSYAWEPLLLHEPCLSTYFPRDCYKYVATR